MKKDIELTGIGNGIIDILVEVPDSFIDKHKLKKADFTLVSIHEQSALIADLKGSYLRFTCGGSVVNSIVTFAALGGAGGVITSIGDDDFSNHYIDGLNENDIKFSPEIINISSATGSCLVLITPDGERTMCTCLGASNNLSPEHITEEVVARSKWIFIEGYLFANDYGCSAITFAIELAKKHETKIALTLSSASLVSAFRSDFEKVLGDTDLLFANHEEATQFTSIKDPEKNALKLSEQCHTVVTASENGSYLAAGNEVEHVSAIATQPVDLTGAGDTYAAGYLYGFIKGFSREKAANLATFLSHKVITKVGARLDEMPFNELKENKFL